MDFNDYIFVATTLMDPHTIMLTETLSAISIGSPLLSCLLQQLAESY